jgi:hypothetical protein
VRSCFIINYWADTDEKVDMVIKGIQQLKKTGRDIIYTSLCPINKRISEITTYSIFHNKNELISLFDLLDRDDVIIHHNISFDSDNFKFYSTPLKWNDVGYSVSTQLINNLKTLKSLGYDYFHFFVGDCLISDDELNIFDHIEKSCHLYNKKAYFDDLTHRFDGYGAIYFSSDIEFFLNCFLSSSNKEDFIKINKGGSGVFCFEKILKNYFEPYTKDLLLGKNNLDSFGHSVLFKTSQLDIISTYNTGTQYHIIPNIDKSLSYIFILSKEEANYTMCIDDEQYESYLGANNWWYCTTNKKQFHLKILKNNKVDFDEMINEYRLNRIHSYSFFDAYKRNI